jgi:hypothetical protein
MTTAFRRLLVCSAVLACIGQAAHAQTIALPDTPPNYNTGKVITPAVYSRNFDDANLTYVNGGDATWSVNTWPSNGVQGAGAIDRVRTPWSTASTNYALRFSPLAVDANGGGLSFNLPLKNLKVNTRYRITLSIGTATGQSTSISLRSVIPITIGNGATIWPTSITKALDLNGPPTKAIVFDGIVLRPDGQFQPGDFSLRFYVSKAGVPFYIDSMSVEEVSANPLNLVEDLSFGKPTGTAPLVMDRRMFGLHVNELGSHNGWPDLGQEIVRTWGTDGSTWFRLQPTETTWDWSVFDYQVRSFLKPVASRRGKGDIIYTLGQTPYWAANGPALDNCAYKQKTPVEFNGGCSAPKDLASFRAYVRTVANTYRDSIKYFEIWNEPGTGIFFGNSPNGLPNPKWLAMLTKEAKAALAEVGAGQMLIGPAVDGDWLDTYLRALSPNDIDAFNFHGYFSPHTIERDMPAMLAQVKLKMQEYGLGGKLLWNTESGAHCGELGLNCSGPVTDTDRYGMLPRALAVQWANGVSNADYFFMEGWSNDWNGLVARPTVMMTNPDGSQSYECNQAKYAPGYCTPQMPLLPPGRGYLVAGNWLKDTKLDSAYKVSGQDIYVFKLRTSAGARRYLVWNASSTAKQVTASIWWGIKTVSYIDPNTPTRTLSAYNQAFTLEPRYPVLLAP